MSRRRPWLWFAVAFAMLLVLLWGTTRLMNRLLLGQTASLAASNVLTVSLAGPLVEQPSQLFAGQPSGPLSLFEIDSALRHAASDPRIDAAVVRVGPLLTGFARAQELRSAIHAFRDSGKPVVARVEIGSLLDLYVAAAADTVVQIPSGNYLLGLVSQRLYYRGLLDRLGIEFDAFHTGDYKTAMSGYTATGMSEAERVAVDALLGDLYEQVVDAIASDRVMTPEAVRAAIDRGLLSGTEAHDLGLVDELGFDDALDAHLGGATPVGVRDYNAASGSSWTLGRSSIALVYVEGMIVPGSPSPSLFGGGRVAAGERIAAALREARADRSVKAVVVRIDSPGGAVTGADVIWREVQITAEQMPVVVSMSDVAASGGYWIATAGTRVMAMPGTYTGSIGVVMGRFHLAGTYDKLGIGSAVVKRGRNADLFVDSQPLTPEQRQRLQDAVDTTYRLFVDKVTAARGLAREDVEALAQGRVWSGQQALELGLIDELGGLRAALSAARRDAGMQAGANVSIREFPRQPGLFEQVRDLMTSARATTTPESPLSALGRRFEGLRRINASGAVWALSDQPIPVATR